MTEAPDARDAVVTCHTEGCTNADQPIRLTIAAGEEPYVVCGVCGQPITDIK